MHLFRFHYQITTQQRVKYHTLTCILMPRVWLCGRENWLSRVAPTWASRCGPQWRRCRRRCCRHLIATAAAAHRVVHRLPIIVRVIHRIVVIARVAVRVTVTIVCTFRFGVLRARIAHEQRVVQRTGTRTVHTLFCRAFESDHEQINHC